MNSEQIIQEATEAIEKNLNAGCYVGDLLRIIKEKNAEIEKLNVELVGMRGACESYKIHYDNAQAEIAKKDTEIGILIRKKEALRDEIAEQQAEKERLEYVLMAVMHSVDKWLEGDELKQDEANRACTMREKTLKTTEKLHKKIDGLKKANQESWVAIEKRKGEIERLNASNNALRKSNEEMFATISKQDAEIERLTVNKNAFALGMKVAKSEAYREFADKLHDNFISKVQKHYCRLNTEHSYKYTEGYTADDVLSTIVNTLEELTRNSHGTCTESNE